jgi:hypothetical protein
MTKLRFQMILEPAIPCQKAKSAGEAASMGHRQVSGGAGRAARNLYRFIAWIIVIIAV